MPLQLNSYHIDTEEHVRGSATCGGAVSIESNYDPAILIYGNTFTDNEAEMGNVYRHGQVLLYVDIQQHVHRQRGEQRWSDIR